LNPSLSNFIAFLRWFSAFLVVLGHCAHILIVDKHLISNPGLATRLLYGITSLGHSAVMVFFVVSGYLVGGITLDKWLARGPNIPDYAISRFSRIYVVLVPALIIGYALDYAGMTWFNGAELYTNSIKYDVGSLSSSVELRLGLKAFIGNVLMLETVAVESLGSNGPLWSLAYEWWYYCLFCLVVGGVLSKGWLRVLMLLCLPVFIWALPTNLFVLGVIWLMGIATYFAVKKAKFPPTPVVGLVVLIVALIAAVLSQNPDNLHHPESMWASFARDCIVALALCFALLCFARADGRWFQGSFHQWAAGFSYSICLFHFPMMLFLVAAANNLFGWPFLMPPSLRSLTYLIALVALLYMLGYLYSLATERYTDVIKSLLRRGLLRAPIITRIFNSSRELA
jgi:peptidoglycan/LPS O-acetylase OafA/YrhL